VSWDEKNEDDRGEIGKEKDEGSPRRIRASDDGIIAGP